MPFADLRSYLHELRKRRDIIEITAPVSPNLELAEIHRRVVSVGGPALLFRSVKGSPFPVVTNLFGTRDRVDLAFGEWGRKLVQEIASLPIECMPPTLGKLWQKREVFSSLARVGMKTKSYDPRRWVLQSEPDLDSLPVLTCWKEDGGPFFTLPLVYTEAPKHGGHNLGMYRMQRFSKSMTGMHMQIGKGGGFHLSQAAELGTKLPLNVFLGGPPVAILAAIAPLPENVPELLLASLLLRGRVALSENPCGPLPFLADAEFVLMGTVDPHERKPEGPFGDHYGYYSLTHDFPVFRCSTVLHRPDAIYPATIVGKPRQEDFYIGEYLQELLSPLFPVVMPTVRDLWSYGETGFHSLAAAVVTERYKREGLVSGFRILGEGQLALTKFLLLVDKPMDLRDFPSVLKYVLERADFRTDLYVFANLSLDTLDYTGPKLNEGSKGLLVGMGDPIRELPAAWHGPLPGGTTDAKVFCPGCLVLSGTSYQSDPNLARSIAAAEELDGWPLVILADNARYTASSSPRFLWSVFTRFEPAADITPRSIEMARFHPLCEPPIVIDCRMKPGYPDELNCDEQTAALVTKRWAEYFPERVSSEVDAVRRSSAIDF